MKALVKTATGSGHLEVLDVAEPSAGPGQAVLEVAYTGICGTDLHIYAGEYACSAPVTLGHEVSGTIVELGDGVEGFRIGDRVTPETYFHTCGRCTHCIRGRRNLCPERRSIGTHVNGGFARYVVVPARNLHAVPDALDLRAAAFTEPLACCLHALVDLARVAPGDTVLVSGPGPIGLLCLQVARAGGARTVLCGIDGDEQRLELGQQLGADRVVNAQCQPLRDVLAELTDGNGPEICVEAAGAGASLRQCLDVARRGGVIAQIGLYARAVEVDINLLPMRELSLLGSWAHVSQGWDRALRLMADGKVRTEPLVSGVSPLTEWQSQFEALHNKRGCKVLLTPSG